MNTFAHCLVTLTAASALIAPLCGQQPAERRATFAGGGGNDGGKCTIEVYVDGSAEVEIRGDRGFLRTLTGQPAQWRRFVCSEPMPANASDFRFVGVDGRGRQDLIQDPRSGRGAAVVRIQDSDGGAEGYTFDVLWRGGSVGSGPVGQPLGGRGRGTSPIDAARACQDAVRDSAYQKYGVSDIDFSSLNADNNPGRNDTILGAFDVRRGNARETYRFSCSVNLANGIVRGVEIFQGRDGAMANRYTRRDNATSACERAAEQRIERDGYRNVQFGSLNAESRRNDRIAGTASAQRGNNGRAYDFDVSCSVNLDNGSIRSVQVSRR